MIYIIGDIIIDRYIYGTAKRLSPEAPVPVVEFLRSEDVGGGALNVFNNIKSLSADVELATSVNYPPIKERTICDGHYVMRVDRESHQKSWGTQTVFPEGSIVVVSDYNKGALKELPQSFYQKYITIVDPKLELGYYAGAWLVKPNRKEFVETCGEFSSIDELRELMVQACKEYDFSNIVVTLGAEGVAVYNESTNEFKHFPTNAREVYDVTGAGDTFTAVLAWAIDSGKSIVDSVNLANKAAGVAVSHHGTYTIKKSDIIAPEPDVIFTNGCFDLLHIGHVKLLQYAKSLGKRLVVGINSDASVKRLKGDSRPINSQDDRVAVLRALGCVDEVIVFDEDTPYNLIKELMPSIIVKGGDYTPNNVVGNDLARVVIFPTVSGHSTTSTIRRVNDAT